VDGQNKKLFLIVCFVCLFVFNQRGLIMGFEKGKLVKNLIYGITHPLQMAREKPLMFLMLSGTGIFFLGVNKGWWSLDVLTKLLGN